VTARLTIRYLRHARAWPEGVCSRLHKLVCGYQSLGDQRVKNITDPVSVYRVLPDPGAVRNARRGRSPVVIGVLAACGIAGVAALSVLVWREHFQPAGDQIAGRAPSPAPATVESAAPPPPVPPRDEPVTEPAMVTLPAGMFAMGSSDDPSERPIHRVPIKAFAIGKFPISVREWSACVAASACKYVAKGDDDAPVTNVSWSDAKQFTTWLSQATQKEYRLPSEAEWEYAARGGTASKYWWGNQPQQGLANCKGCNEPYDAKQPLKVGSFLPNPFGLYDMGGGVDQWVEDCWHKNYQGAPTGGEPWLDPDCATRVLRGGSWKSEPANIRTASRDQYDTNVRYFTHGFRVARTP
jgi:formylglycine-generating enzyme required for sulfatase activity